MNPALFFWLFLKASLLSTGGQGNLPSLHADLIARGWADERGFAEALLVGQTAPGPNGLWTVSLGYLAWGVPGAVLSLVAITLPPFLILLAERLYRRLEGHTAVEGFLRGMTLAVGGISLVTLSRVLADVGGGEFGLALASAALLLGLWKRVPLVLILSLAAFAGWLHG